MPDDHFIQVDSPWSIPRDGVEMRAPVGVGQTRNRRVSRKSDMTTSTEVAKVSTYDSSMERLKSALVEVAGLTALLNRFGNQEPPVGSVLRWVKQYDARSGELIVEGVGSTDELHKALRFNVTQPSEYVFLAFRAPNGKWYVTAQRGASTYEWDALLREIGDAPCELATEWTVVPAPEKPSEEALDPVVWAKQLFGGKKNDA